ncbi:MAG TPA: hypothetical protein DEB39_07595 [Planctomycetaceae bacterium]|nr:hypothetical protein [Planctomycetaceae bacterium]
MVSLAPRFHFFAESHIHRKRPENVPANNRLLLERNMQPDIFTDVVVSERNKQSSPNNPFHRVSCMPQTA